MIEQDLGANMFCLAKWHGDKVIREFLVIWPLTVKA